MRISLARNRTYFTFKHSIDPCFMHTYILYVLYVLIKLLDFIVHVFSMALKRSQTIHTQSCISQHMLPQQYSSLHINGKNARDIFMSS